MAHKPSIYRHLILLAVSTVTCASAQVPVVSNTANVPQPASTAPRAALQDVEELESLAKNAALQALPPLTETQRLVVGPLQPRLKLSVCDNKVDSKRAPGLQTPGRVMIELRCEGQTPWHLYVPVKVVGTTAVVVAAHALVAGTVLSAKDLAVEQRDMVGLPPGYLNDPSIAIGLTAGRGVSGGAIVTNQQLLGAQAVQRGQTVTLIADAGGISVRMAGRALSDGFINQRVRVENLSSGKIVEGIAISAQVVQINF
jgi:flagella basal body P-ring formation protein FlgA